MTQNTKVAITEHATFIKRNLFWSGSEPTKIISYVIELPILRDFKGNCKKKKFFHIKIFLVIKMMYAKEKIGSNPLSYSTQISEIIFSDKM